MVNITKVSLSVKCPRFALSWLAVCEDNDVTDVSNETVRKSSVGALDAKFYIFVVLLAKKNNGPFIKTNAKL